MVFRRGQGFKLVNNNLLGGILVLGLCNDLRSFSISFQIVILDYRLLRRCTLTLLAWIGLNHDGLKMVITRRKKKRQKEMIID